MKKLDSFSVFQANYFCSAGVLMLALSSIWLHSGILAAIGSFMAVGGGLVVIVSCIRELQMTNFGRAITPSQVRIVAPAPSVVHIRGVFFFVLECICEGRIIQSPLMALPKWSKHVRNGALASAPEVTVYEKDGKTLVKAFL